MQWSEILSFWFEEIEPAQWWIKDEDFDQLIVDRFSVIHKQACRCELSEWRETAHGGLAEIIVLDQFSRNIFRGSPKSFVNDPLALVLAQYAVARGADQELDQKQRCFFYLPYMHSESRVIHEQAMQLYTANGLENELNFEIKHRDIIERFDRYPHRNKILGRSSTPEEVEFLNGPGSSF